MSNLFSLDFDLSSIYKSLRIGCWLLITWRWEDWRVLDLSVDWYRPDGKAIIREKL